MARATRRRRSAAPRTTSAETPREKIIAALMELLAKRSLGSIGLGEVAEQAGVSLATLRETYDGKVAILADWSRRLDVAVLEQGPAEEGEARDRLFEVLMRRFDALAPYKHALHGLAHSARRDLGLACALEAILARSQKWMLVAAGIHQGGRLGAVAIRGAELVYLDAMRTWFDDDDPGLASTMAALDRALKRGERAMQWLDHLCGFVPRGRRRRGSDEAGAKA
jgi:AcrR family transcriptional regulator